MTLTLPCSIPDNLTGIDIFKVHVYCTIALHALNNSFFLLNNNALQNILPNIYQAKRNEPISYI